jgi:hypothetical protein
MQVRHGLGAGQALAVARGRSGARGGQALDLTIANTGWAGVASMDAVVHFAASNPGLLLLGEDAGGEPLTTPLHIGRRIATGAGDCRVLGSGSVESGEVCGAHAHHVFRWLGVVGFRQLAVPVCA